MKKIFISCLALVVIIFMLSSKSHSSVIDFEIVPGETPADELAISNQYESLYGVTFMTYNVIDGYSTPYLEAVGESDSGHGFKRQVGDVAYDLPRAGYEGELGNYFLRLWTSDLGSSADTQLIITYSNPVSAASAQIWDLDARTAGYEQWMIRAWDAGNNVIDTKYSPVGINPSLPGTLDSLPWTWSFDHGATADIYKVTLDFVGEYTGGGTGGLAFDNFSPSSASPVVPEPVSSILFITGGVTLAFRHFRKKL